ncbi:hypothetical protein PENTCL1PPCAC_19725, partial [Pristionchus entomophagus]
MPRTDFIIQSKGEELEKLTSNVLPETRKFVKEVQNKLIYSIELIMIEREAAEMIAKVATTQITLKYKILSAESKRDLERYLCSRNIMKWLNAEMGGHMTELSAIFAEV